MLFHLFSFTILSAILGVSGMKDKLLLVPALEGSQSKTSQESSLSIHGALVLGLL